MRSYVPFFGRQYRFLVAPGQKANSRREAKFCRILGKEGGYNGNIFNNYNNFFDYP